MNLFKIINFIILAFSIALMVVGISQFFNSFVQFDDLVHHKGVVESKYLSSKYFFHRSSFTRKDEKDSVFIFNFKLIGDQQEYTASRYPEGINNLIEVGDSIDFYTRPVRSKYGNTVNNGKGRFWNTRSPNETFHLVSKKYSDPVLDFYEYRSDLKSSWWVFPLFSIITFCWYLHRRSRRKFPLVREYSSVG